MSGRAGMLPDGPSFEGVDEAVEGSHPLGTSMPMAAESPTTSSLDLPLPLSPEYLAEPGPPDVGLIAPGSRSGFWGETLYDGRNELEAAAVEGSEEDEAGV